MTVIPEPPSVTTDKIHQHLQVHQDHEEISSADDTSPHRSLLVTLQPEGTGTKVIFCPSFRNTAMFYQDLAVQLAPDMPVYSFNWPEPTPYNPPADTLPLIAEEFLKDLKTRVPHGPYIVGSYCFGAVIAIEMAKKLVATGEQVKLLVLIDPVRPSTGNQWQRRKMSLFSFIRFYRQRGIRFFIRTQYRKGIEMVQDLRFDTKEKWERRLQTSHHRAFNCYQVASYPHPALLAFSNAEQVESDTERYSRQEGRWKNIIPIFRDILVLPDCTHFNILSRGAGKIAASIREIEGEIEKAI